MTNEQHTLTQVTTSLEADESCLSVWQEFTMVLLRLRLGLFTKDLAARFRVSVSTVSSVCRTWIMFMNEEGTGTHMCPMAI